MYVNTDDKLLFRKQLVYWLIDRIMKKTAVIQSCYLILLSNQVANRGVSKKEMGAQIPHFYDMVLNFFQMFL